MFQPCMRGRGRAGNLSIHHRQHTYSDTMQKALIAGVSRLTHQFAFFLGEWSAHQPSVGANPPCKTIQVGQIGRRARLGSSSVAGWANQGYTGTLQRWTTEHYDITLEVVYPPSRQMKRYASEMPSEANDEGGFQVLPRRWVVERTFSWLGRQRWLRKDFERLTSTAETWIYLTAIRLLLTRLACC